MNTVIKLKLFFLLFSMIGIGNSLQGADSKEQLRQLLRDHPEMAEQFLKKIAKKTKTPQITPPVKPATPIQPKPEPAPVIQPKPKPEPAPVEKVWITEQERNDIHSILTILETYSARVFIALESFFSKNNHQSLKTHVAGLKAQLAYLRQNLIDKFPKAQTPERQALFTQLHNVTKAMEQAQILLCGVLDKNYSQLTGLVSLPMEFKKISMPLDQQKKITNQNTIELRKALQTGKMQDTAARIVRLQTALNKIFDYGKNSPGAIISGVSHRLKQK